MELKPCLLSSFILFNEKLKECIFYIHESVYVTATVLVMFTLFCCNSFRKAIATIVGYYHSELSEVTSC